MYDKQKINKLFIKYCDTGDDKVLENLLRACEGLINIIVTTKYPQFKSYKDDMRQDVCIKIIERLRDPQKRENLKKQYQNPIAYLYGWLWVCVFRSMKQYAKDMSAPLPLTDFEEQIINLHGREKLSFEQISEQLEISEEIIEGCYYIGKAKMHLPISSGDNFEGMIDRSSGDLINPSKKYEMEDLRKNFEAKIKTMADKHPVYSKSESLKKKFIEEVTSLFQEEVGGDNEGQ